jgi:hypothetical protein
MSSRPEETDYGRPCMTLEELQVFSRELEKTQNQNAAIIQLMRIHNIETRITGTRVYAKDEWIDAEGIDLSDWVDITDWTMDVARKWLGY